MSPVSNATAIVAVRPGQHADDQSEENRNDHREQARGLNDEVQHTEKILPVHEEDPYGSGTWKTI